MFPANLIEDEGHLTGLFFEDNQIESLPEGLEKLNRLTSLSLRNNPLVSQSESIQMSL